jgi:hypothetical protein
MGDRCTSGSLNLILSLEILCSRKNANWAVARQLTSLLFSDFIIPAFRQCLPIVAQQWSLISRCLAMDVTESGFLMPRHNNILVSTKKHTISLSSSNRRKITINATINQLLHPSSNYLNNNSSQFFKLNYFITCRICYRDYMILRAIWWIATDRSLRNTAFSLVDVPLSLRMRFRLIRALSPESKAAGAWSWPLTSL